MRKIKALEEVICWKKKEIQKKQGREQVGVQAGNLSREAALNKERFDTCRPRLSPVEIIDEETYMDVWRKTGHGDPSLEENLNQPVGNAGGCSSGGWRTCGQS